MTKLHQAAIVSHKPAGRGYYRLVLKAPEMAVSAVPGQFVMLRVTENMDPLLARPFGVSSVISKTSVEIYYRVVGRGTRLLTGMEPGHALLMHGPFGNGFSLPDTGVVPIMVIGGSGFPPLLFLSGRTRACQRLFIGSKNKESMPPAGVMRRFREKAEKMHIATEDGSQGKRGLVTVDLEAYIGNLKKDAKTVIYACGPRPMLAAVSKIAADSSIPCYVTMEERMACGFGACMGCSVAVKAGGYKRVCKEGPVFDSREIEWGEKIGRLGRWEGGKVRKVGG